ncbi:hypothetical protein OS493_023726 [Desmophyllum pertusum]|uniref:Uncharacterized protein n=1 Tax=Desmophyllum pertusum TaxID=174260 RepID=A0A9W9YYI6_9CNID|nr:hypothetical protein OS493_023726 [Desmophyllum pertusum]
MALKVLKYCHAEKVQVAQRKVEYFYVVHRCLSQMQQHTKTLLIYLMLDSVDAWSRETIISETGSAEIEVLDGWESDVNGQEEGYFTGDNVFVDYTVHKLDLQPNELGELHSGVMYIREHPWMAQEVFFD